ncbi:MAG: hypothetical protein EXR68_05560 [Dehalococcoidia bacterium]|nr:hypothetical protein [Dehalococcoidia bacterium]
MSDLPQFHSKEGSRTRPARRRTERLVLSTRELMRQKSLSKAFLVIASLVAFISIITAEVTRIDGGTSTPSDTTAGATSIPGAVLVSVVKIVDGDTIDVALG